MLKSKQTHKQMHRQHGEIILQARQEVVPSTMTLQIKWRNEPIILPKKGKQAKKRNLLKVKSNLWFM